MTEAIAKETSAVEPFEIHIKLDEDGVISTIINDVFVRTGLTAVEVTAGLGGYTMKEHSYPYLSRQGKKNLEEEKTTLAAMTATQPENIRTGPYL